MHANPGPDVVPPGARAEHNPPHVHLGGNDGPRVSTETWEPLTAEDEKRMSRKQKKFCKSLPAEAKDLISKRQQGVFRHGKALLGIMAGPQILSITRACNQDPMYCLDLIQSGGL